jgi:hypothetical protein
MLTQKSVIHRPARSAAQSRRRINCHKGWGWTLIKAAAAAAAFLMSGAVAESLGNTKKWAVV